MPIAPDDASKEKKSKSFYPYDPFTLTHFNMRHPVITVYCKSF